MWYLCWNHHWQKVYDLIRVISQYVQRLSTILLKTPEIIWSYAAHYFGVFWRKGDRSSLPFYVEFCLEITQEMPEVNMEELSVLLNHNVSWMTIAYSQNISCYKISDTGSQKILFSHKKISSFVVVLKERKGRFDIKCLNNFVLSVVLMNQRTICRIFNYLDKSILVSSRQNPVNIHFKIKTIGCP